MGILDEKWEWPKCPEEGGSGSGAKFVTFTTHDMVNFDVSHSFEEVKTLMESGTQVVGLVEAPSMGLKVFAPNVCLFGAMHISFTGYVVSGDIVNGTTAELTDVSTYTLAINSKNNVLMKQL